jgi:hypothetical protein
MSDDFQEAGLGEESGSFKARGEEALGDIAQSLLENPLFSQVLARTLGAGEKAIQAQRSALSALDVPTASELERLGRRVRSLSDRIEALEDGLDAVARDVAAIRERVERDVPADAPAAAPSSAD